MDVIPSLDLLDGKVVRLLQGDFARVTTYGDPEMVLASLDVPPGSRLHIVDLEASRSGRPVETGIVRRLATQGLHIQAGGGIRSLEDARTWIEAGAEKVVIGTVAADAPDVLRSIVDELGAACVIAAIDVRDGIVRVAGWEREATASLGEVLTRVEELGIREVLITDISRDGALRGPSFALYRSLDTKMRIIASGGVTTSSDVVSLGRIPTVGGCVIGRALLEGRIRLAEARARVGAPNLIPERVIPCLDVRDGRVVKGVNFIDIRDAGDPVRHARSAAGRRCCRRSCVTHRPES